MKQECGIISKISNIGHILKYCNSIVSDLNFQYRPSLILLSQVLKQCSKTFQKIITLEAIYITRPYLQIIFILALVHNDCGFQFYRSTS